MMAETKFTPGPWVTIDNGSFWDVLEKSPGYRGQVCSVHDAENIKGISRAEQTANAHLIAAAPELYESLNELASILNGDGRTYVQEALERADAASAKARGEKL